MIVEVTLSVLVGFVVVVAGSYVGAKMALNTFFGRDFTVSGGDQRAVADAFVQDEDR